jgi:hypothetical protein
MTEWRFYLCVHGGVFTFVFEVELELKREQPPAPAARSERKY